MKTVLTKAGEFTYLAELRHLATQPDSYHLSIQSTFGGAKDPEGLRTLFQVTTDAAGLAALRDLIDGVVVTPIGSAAEAVAGSETALRAEMPSP